VRLVGCIKSAPAYGLFDLIENAARVTERLVPRVRLFYLLLCFTASLISPATLWAEPLAFRLQFFVVCELAGRVLNGDFCFFSGAFDVFTIHAATLRFVWVQVGKTHAAA
jgi:hypothetical protein